MRALTTTLHQLRALLIRLFAHGPATIVRSAATGRADWQVARAALRIGFIELTEDAPLPRNLKLGGLREIRIAQAGRAALGVPDPAPIGDRSPVEVIGAGVKLFMGAGAITVTAREEGAPDSRMIARANYHTVDGWPDAIDAVVVYAGEQGVPCEAISENPRGDEWHVTGFAAGAS